MQSFIKDKIEDLKKLCRAYEVKSMYVFGSASTGSSFTNESDVDILIAFKDISIEAYTDNYFNLNYELQGLFDRKIDLLTENSLSNPYLIESIEETKLLLYAA